MANVKIQKLEKQIERELSQIFLNDVKEDLGFITITSVDLTNDLSFAKIYYTVFGNEDKRESVSKKLEKAKGFIRTMLGSKVQMRKVPDLIFVYDQSLDYGNKIENLLKDIKSKDQD